MENLLIAVANAIATSATLQFVFFRHRRLQAGSTFGDGDIGDLKFLQSKHKAVKIFVVTYFTGFQNVKARFIPAAL